MTMRKLTIQFCLWLIGVAADNNGLRVLYVPPVLVEEAKEVVQYVEQDIPNASSENKHARAYARLRRLAPEASRRDVSLAIELALRA